MVRPSRPQCLRHPRASTCHSDLRISRTEREREKESVRISKRNVTCWQWIAGSLTLEVYNALLGSLDQNRLVNGFVALELVAARRTVADEALLALEHQNRPVDQIEVELGRLLDRLGRREQVAGALGRQQLAVVGAERHRPVAVPFELEQCVSRAAVAGRLDAASGRQAPVAVLRGAQRPPVGGPVELELERFVLADLVLVGGHVHALLHRHVLAVQCGDEGRLRQRVLQREQLVARHRLRAGLQHRLRADRRQVQAVPVAQRQMAAVVLGREQAVVGALVLQLAVRVEIPGEVRGLAD